MDQIGEIFLSFSLRKLELLSSRINDCLSRLDDEKIWVRDGDHANAVGNLVLHLAGNVRQWVIAGIGGEPDIRRRDAEFTARNGMSGDELKELLETTVRQAIAVIQKTPPERLSEQLTIQGYKVSVLEALYTVVEHFAEHTGQIIFATKLLTGLDLGYYRHLSKPSHSEPTP